MWLIKFALFGLVAGAIARMLHPGRDPMHWFGTMLLGMAGALFGGWLGNLVGYEGDTVLMRWILAIAGSVILLILYHAATARRALGGPRGPATTDDYRNAVFNDLSRGPRP